MADTLTRDDGTTGTVYKTFVLGTTNTLFSRDNRLGHVHLDGSQFGRPFVPTRVTIAYSPFPRVRVFTRGASNTSCGSVIYYNPATVPVNANQGRPISGTTGVGQLTNPLPLSSMPNWLSTLVVPYI